MPAARCTVGGTESMWIRTGIRWASRTQVNTGLTDAKPNEPGSVFGVLIPRAMLSTWPCNGSR